MRKINVLIAILIAVIAGIVVPLLVLFLPFGIMILILAVFDSKLTVLNELGILIFSPYIIISFLTILGNLRMVFIENGKERDGITVHIRTDFYLSDNSRFENINNNLGKMLSDDLRTYLSNKENDLKISDSINEDYGWCFWVNRFDKQSPVWVAISYVERTKSGKCETDQYAISINMKPPFLPWKRLSYNPDYDLQSSLVTHLKLFLQDRKIKFST